MQSVLLVVGAVMAGKTSWVGIAGWAARAHTLWVCGPVERNTHERLDEAHHMQWLGEVSALEESRLFAVEGVVEMGASVAG